MKNLALVFFVSLWVFIIVNIVHASYFDTGWTEFRQPNGSKFIGRMWGDEWNYTFQTRDGYPFDKSFADGYYYYAHAQRNGVYQLSNLRVGINPPTNIPRQLSAQIPKPVSTVSLGKSGAKPFDGNQLAATTWTLKVILVEFQDVQGNLDWERADFSNMLFSSNYYVSPSVNSPSGDDVFGSLRDYYDTMSNGNLNITGQILNEPLPGGDTPNWIRLSYNKNWYRNNSYWNLHNEAIDSAQARGYDVNTGTTTKLVILYAGNFYLSNLNPRNLGDSYIMFERWGGRGNYDGNDYNVPFGHIGVHAHEFGHFFWGFDLYRSPYNIIDWSLMGDAGDLGGTLGGSFNTRGSCPGPINPELRRREGWTTVQDITSDLLPASFPYNETTPTVYRRQINTNEYLLIENRRFQDFSRFLPGYSLGHGGGLLIWHVLSSGSTIYLERADNVADGDYYNGEPDDIFPGPNVNNRNFDSNTTPNSNTFSGAVTHFGVNYISDPVSIMTANLNTIISSNTTWSGNVYVGADITVDNGVTLTIEPGTTIDFDSGVKLTINGTLDVKGLFANTVTFDRSGSSDWGGIVINSASGSSSNITFTTIINAGTGLDINGASPTISNTKINNCGTGVRIQSGAAPKFANNTITYNDYNGVACYGGATPSFGYFPTWGDNVIRRNGDRGVYAAYSCTVFLGQNATPPSGGRNSIYENYNANGYQISILYGSSAMAEKNWWGSDPPSSGIFENISTIDYTPWWTGSDPHGSRPLTRAINADTETSPTAGGNVLTEAGSLKQQLWQAFILYQKAKYDSAMQISRDIIKMAPSSDEAFSALNVLRISHVESGKTGMEDYLHNLIAKHVGEEIAGVARLNLAWYFLRKDKPADALAQLQENVTSFSNNAIERITLFQKMVVYLLNLEDRKAAEAAFAELKVKYPDDPLVGEAQRLLGQSPQQNQQQQLTTFNAAEPQRNSTALSNYPNPFNPETRIQYQLSEASTVRIKIFNVAGKLVRSFEAGLQPAGVHSVVWNSKDNLGQQVSSGVYIYQLTVAPLSGNGERFEMSRKFTLVR